MTKCQYPKCSSNEPALILWSFKSDKDEQPKLVPVCAVCAAKMLKIELKEGLK